MRFSSVRRVLTALVLALAGLGLFPAAASADAPATVLFNQFSERCPDAASGYQDMHPCAPADNPGMWVISRLAPNRYTITDVRDHNACLTSADAPVVQPCALSDERQKWEITRYEPEPGRYGMVGMRIKNAKTGWCLDNSKKTFGGWTITQRACLDDTHQQWDIYRTTYEAVWGTPGAHAGMTWTTLAQRADNVVHVGFDDLSRSNPYQGDTPSSAVLPMLCIYRDGRPAPGGVPTDGYHAWSGGEVRATTPVAGWQLPSRQAADQRCSDSFGGGWRMAEFHDGNGWGLWAHGTLPGGTRFWTAINDQPANPWS
ncbi:RICIN domain-containing protein [Kitasatospora sp. NPDC005856]|uniref:RICIN domain-containing protein n=1 Tax=Kitasatospora sp. NPDC005856 TaxID=3154566 RepID=UPI0033ECB1B2